MEEEKLCIDIHVSMNIFNIVGGKSVQSEPIG